MSEPGAIVPAPPAALVRTKAATREELARARARVLAQLDALDETLAPARRVREGVQAAVRRHPVLTITGAFLLGYGLARWIFRDDLGER